MSTTLEENAAESLKDIQVSGRVGGVRGGVHLHASSGSGAARCARPGACGPRARFTRGCEFRVKGCVKCDIDAVCAGCWLL